MSNKMTRRNFLKTVSAVAATSLFAGYFPVHAGSEVGEKTFFPQVLNGRASGQLNLITILCDTLRYDHVGFHGNSWIHTPNIDAFASQAVVFDRACAGGFPTLLNRAELFTGRWLYHTIGWDDLPATETHIGDILSDGGYITGIVFDNWQLKDECRSYERGFDSWEWIRGQVTDRFRPTPIEPELPAHPSKFRNGASEITQYLRNVSGREDESDYLVAQTMSAAIAWLERMNNAGPFYLHIDCFDPHEPWDPPRNYVELYDPGYVGEEVIYPAYAPPAYLNAAELNHMRALYAGEVTMVDHWLGKLFTAIDTLGLSENTAIVLMSDHGFLLGEHDAVGKSCEDAGVRHAYPLWQELAHIVLMVRSPEFAPRRTLAMAQPADITPTLLDLAGIERPTNLQGVSLVPTLRTRPGEQEPILRPVAVSARSLLTPLEMLPTITVNNGEWTLIHGGGHTASSLYHLPNDPYQQVDLLPQKSVIARSLHAQLIAFLEEMHVPESHIGPWRPAPY